MLKLDVQGQIVTLTLSNHLRRNAMTRAMWRDLASVPSQLDGQVRCLLIRGEGEHFCAGGDISEYPQFRFEQQSLAHFHEQEVAPGLEALLSLDIPILAVIDGNCMGGGLEIASCADIRLASVRASFGAPIAKLGMPMAPRELELLVRVAGDATVRDMLLTAAIFDATHMYARGFVQRLCDADQLHETAVQMAQRMAALSPQAAQLNKQALRAIFKPNMPLVAENTACLAIKNVAKTISPYAYAASREHREGIQAFLEKRSPKF